MAYKALYRQFRPRRFSEIKDQPSVSKIIKNQVRSGKPAHAYVFSGPRGTGKTSTAKILACALNCLAPEDGEPCLKCDNCLAALNDTMPDIVEIDAASNTRVDDARALIEKIGLLPVNGRYKVYIIDEAHMLSQAAFNALLKTIEEPPDYAVFILATTELRKLPKTVLSRCQRFDFRAIDTSGIKERLEEVLANIGKTADDDALNMISEAADGGMRDALTILEKVCSVEDHVSADGVASVLNFAESGKIRRLTDCIVEYNEKSALELLLDIQDSGIEPSTLVSQLIVFLRELLVCLVTGEGRYFSDAEKWSKSGLIKAIEVLADAETRMSVSSKPHILLEAAILKLLLPERADAFEDESLRIEKLEKKLSEFQTARASESVKSVRQKEKAEKNSEQKSVQNAGITTTSAHDARSSGKTGSDIWEEMMASIKSSDLPLYARLRGIEAASFENGTLVLTSASPSKLSLFSDEASKRVLTAYAEKAAGHKVLIETENLHDDKADIPDDIEIID